MDTALVVFSGETDLKYLRLLKPGFRHCFVILRLHDRWISIDPLAHMTRVDLYQRDLSRLLDERGLTVVETPIRDAPPVQAAPMLCTCVEMVKRVLGIQCWHVVTPWQLYRYLRLEQSRGT